MEASPIAMILRNFGLRQGMYQPIAQKTPWMATDFLDHRPTGPQAIMSAGTASSSLDWRQEAVTTNNIRRPSYSPFSCRRAIV